MTLDALATIVVLAAAGALPVLTGVGPRWVALPLCPLGGAVLAALGASGVVAVGGSLLAWFTALAAAGAVVSLVWWWRVPDRRPWAGAPSGPTAAWDRHRVAGLVGFLVVAAVAAWCLRVLTTPAIGFDARTIWLMRAGWLLEPHGRLLTDLRLPSLVLYQTAYPPLTSAAAALSWGVTGDHSLRLGAVVVAILNGCALAAAALAVVECGRDAASRLRDRSGHSDRRDLVPLVIGVVAAAALVVVGAGVAGPFLSDGYADPLWSFAAVGALAYGLQLHPGRGRGAVVALLLVVAGMTKVEGAAIGALLVALVALRSLTTRDRSEPGWWWRPVALAVVELAAIAWWPLLMRAVHARGASETLAPVDRWPGRVHPIVDGIAPYLHVLPLTAAVTIVGGLALRRDRRRSGAANDAWGWAGLAAALVGVGAVLATDSGAIGPLLTSTIHRLAELPALIGWWIVAVWAVVGAAAAVSGRAPQGPEQPAPGPVSPGAPPPSA